MAFDKTELLIYCQMVQRGKPAASIPVKEVYMEEAQNLVNDFGLRVYAEPLSEGWITLWIYNYQHILEIIKTVPDKPETAFDHWVLGKLFGYDESSIGEFLTVTLT